MEKALKEDIEKAVKGVIEGIRNAKCFCGELARIDQPCGSCAVLHDVMIDGTATMVAARIEARLDIDEGERCSLCGACPICGKRTDHAH